MSKATDTMSALVTVLDGVRRMGWLGHERSKMVVATTGSARLPTWSRNTTCIVRAPSGGIQSREHLNRCCLAGDAPGAKGR